MEKAKKYTTIKENHLKFVQLNFTVILCNYLKNRANPFESVSNTQIRACSVIQFLGVTGCHIVHIEGG